MVGPVHGVIVVETEFLETRNWINVYSWRISLVTSSNSGGDVYVPSRMALAVGVMELYLNGPLSGPEHIGVSSAR